MRSVNELICMDLHFCSIICALSLRGPAKNASSILPSMLDIFEANIAVNVIEMDHGVFAIRKFGAIQAAPGKMRGQLGDGDAVKLMLENMVRALLQIRIQRLKALEEPFRNFTQKHTTLAGWVYKNAVFDTNRKSLLRHISAEKGLK